MKNLLAQKKDSLINEKTRVLISTSVETDGCHIYNGNWNDWIKTLNNHYQSLDIKKTKKLELNDSKDLDSILNNYNIQLFKMMDYNSEKESRYLLNYTDFNSNVWLRVGGYVENDLNLLFDYFIRNKTNKKDILKKIEKWEASNVMYTELNLKCKFKGYRRGKAIDGCFKSVFYIKMNDVQIGREEKVKRKNINSIFSRIPLYGTFNNF
jgi:hypothetical protein